LKNIPKYLFKCKNENPETRKETQGVEGEKLILKSKAHSTRYKLLLAHEEDFVTVILFFL
jgi:hypothetical protein